jgi:hypothetical protein
MINPNRENKGIFTSDEAAEGGLKRGCATKRARGSSEAKTLPFLSSYVRAPVAEYDLGLANFVPFSFFRQASRRM